MAERGRRQVRRRGTDRSQEAEARGTHSASQTEDRQLLIVERSRQGELRRPLDLGSLNGGQAQSPVWADSVTERAETTVRPEPTTGPTQHTGSHCSAGSRGPGEPGLQLGGGWGGVGLSKPLANLTTTVTRQPQARAPFSSSAKAFPPSGAENSSSTTGVGGTQNTSPDSDKQPKRTALFCGHFGLGSPGVGPQRAALLLRALPAALFEKPCSLPASIAPPIAPYLPPLSIFLSHSSLTIKPPAGWLPLDSISHHPFAPLVPPPSSPSAAPLPHQRDSPTFWLSGGPRRWKKIREISPRTSKKKYSAWGDWTPPRTSPSPFVPPTSPRALLHSAFSLNSF